MYIAAILTFLFGALTIFIGVVERLSAKDAGYGLEKYIDYSAMQTAETIITIGVIVTIVSGTFLFLKIISDYQKRKRQLNTKKCTSCGNIADINQKFCNKCGNCLK